MSRRVLRAVVALLIGLALIAPQPNTQRARALTPDTVLVWNAIAMTAILPTAGTSGLVRLANVHAAVYDAVNAIAGGYQPYLGAPAAAANASQDAAAAAAAHGVLSNMYPAQQVTVFDPALAATVAAINDGSDIAAGLAVGVAAAMQMINAPQGHPIGGSFQFTQLAGVGNWRPVATGSDPNAWVKDVKPFIIDSGTQFRSRGPNAVTSGAYAKDFNEVKAYGSFGSTVRSDDQTDMARFWADNAFGLWSRISRQLSENNGLSTAENARFFAMLYLTAADAQITVWNDKEFYHYWRPLPAILEAGGDGNHKTDPDTGWTALIGTPPYPEHPSGASSVASAFGQTLRRFFGTDKMTFSTLSNFSGTTRSFSRFSQAVKEVVDARVYEGIHFRTADTQGAFIGKRVAHWVGKHAFRPVD